jgi:hypothetical protein
MVYTTKKVTLPKSGAKKVEHERMIVPWFAELDPNEESKTQQKPKTLFTRKMVGGEESC